MYEKPLTTPLPPLRGGSQISIFRWFGIDWKLKTYGTFLSLSKLCDRISCSPYGFFIPKIEFLELDNDFGHFAKHEQYPNQIFCPIEKILIFREMQANFRL